MPVAWRAAVLVLLAAPAWSCGGRSGPPGMPDAERSSLSIEPELAVADGAARILVRVQVRDAAGVPVPGARVEVNAACSSIRFHQPGPTGADGIGIAEARATFPGRYRVSAKLAARGRTVLLDHDDAMRFVPPTQGPRVDAFPFGRGP